MEHNQLTTAGVRGLGQIFEEVVQQDSVAPMVVYFLMTSLDPVRHLQPCPFLVLHQSNMAALVEVLVPQKAEREYQNEWVGDGCTWIPFLPF